MAKCKNVIVGCGLAVTTASLYRDFPIVTCIIRSTRDFIRIQFR